LATPIFLFNRRIYGFRARALRPERNIAECPLASDAAQPGDQSKPSDQPQKRRGTVVEQSVYGD